MGVIVKETLPVVDAIAAKIDDRGISVRDAAAMIGVNFRTLYNWLNANTNPPMNAETIPALARFLEVPRVQVVELFGVDLGSESEHLGP